MNDSKGCWILVRPDCTDWDNGDFAPHHHTEDEALQEVESHKLTDVKVVQLESPCVVISCGCCEEMFDESGEGHIVHFEEEPDPEILAASDWTQADDGYRCVI